MNPKPAAHTPTPWIRRESKSDVIWIEDGNGRVVMHNSSVKDPEDQANAAFIVRAVNAHEELLAALHEARYLLIGHGRRSDMIDKAMAKAEAQ